jgi:hypothetical protein
LAGEIDCHLIPLQLHAERPVMTGHRIFRMSAVSLYHAYLNKVERKGRSRAELDEVICWMTGHTPASLRTELAAENTFEAFFVDAPALNPLRELVTGKVCGVQVEAVEDPLMREIRRLDKLVDEIAKGRAMDKVLRRPAP